MNLALFIGLFLIIVVGLFSFGLAAWPASSVLGMRIQSLLGRPLAERKKPDVEGRLEQVLEPISKAVPKSPEELSNIRLSLTRAGYREPHHVHMYFGVRGLMLLVGVAVMANWCFVPRSGLGCGGRRSGLCSTSFRAETND